MASDREKFFLLFNLSKEERSWRGFWILIAVYLGAILLSAILSPWVYWLIQFWAQKMPNELNLYLSRKSFDDYFDRLRWIPLILSLPWIMRICGLLSWGRLGVCLGRKPLVAAFRWFLLGVGVVAIAAWVQWAFASVDYVGRETWLGLLGVIAKALMGGILLGLLEEVVFRGLIFRIFYSAMASSLAVVLSSAFFAYTHFKMPGAIWDATDQVVTWKSGFFVGFWTLAGIFKDFEWLPFLNLWALGGLLCLVFMRFNSLLPCMGFHAGIVAVLLSYKKLFSVHDSALRWLLGGDKMIDGVVPFVIIVGLALFVSLASARPLDEDVDSTLQ